jgi:peptide/nickel transport system permease protein
MPILITKRLASMVVIVVMLAAAVFFLQHISPLDPVHAALGGQASASAVAQERHALGLDKSITAQLFHYLGRLLHGDLGTSYRTRRPVSTDLADYLPATAELAITGLIIALALATVFAVASVLRWPGAAAFRVLLMIGASTPVFLLGIGGILVFYKQLNWLPATGRISVANAPTGPTGLLVVDSLVHGNLPAVGNALQHLAMPATAIALGPAVSIGRVLRSSLETELHSDYARTARAKGLSELRILRKHIARNSVGAALSMTGLQVGLMFAGVLVIEQVFGWPGIGQYVAQSIPVADFPAIAGVTLLLGVGYVAINTVVDILQALADPRLSL